MVSLKEEMNLVEQLVRCLKSHCDFVNISALCPRGYQGILDHPGKKPFIQIVILVGKVIVAKMYLNLIIIIIANQYFDSFLTNSVREST